MTSKRRGREEKDEYWAGREEKNTWRAGEGGRMGGIGKGKG